MQFLGLETPSFLRAQCLVSRLEDEFPIVGSAVFFHQGNVVWSQLQQEDTRFGTFIQGGGPSAPVVGLCRLRAGTGWPKWSLKTSC